MIHSIHTDYIIVQANSRVIEVLHCAERSNKTSLFTNIDG